MGNIVVRGDGLALSLIISQFHDVIKITGQWWLLVLAMIAMIIGSFAPIWEETGITVMIGTVLAIVGYALALAFIRCPNCANRWFWTALMRAELYGPLFKTSACPVCEHEFKKS